MPSKRAGRAHQWTSFEKRALICLMCRDLHITGFEEVAEVAFGRNIISATAKRRRKLKKIKNPRHAYMDVATALNKAINNGSYNNDIPFKDVSTMIDKILHEKKGAVAFMQAQPYSRITRTTRRVMDRGLSFIGNEKEWKAGRKQAEEKLRRDRECSIARGDSIEVLDGEEFQQAQASGDGWNGFGDTVASAVSQIQYSGDQWGDSEATATAPAKAPTGIDATLDDDWGGFGDTSITNIAPVQTQLIDDDWGGVKTAAATTSAHEAGGGEWHEEDTASTSHDGVPSASSDFSTSLTQPTRTSSTTSKDVWGGSGATTSVNTSTSNDKWQSSFNDSWGNINPHSSKQAAKTVSDLDNNWGGNGSAAIAMEMSVSDDVWGGASSFSAHTISNGIQNTWDNPLPSTEVATPNPTPTLAPGGWGVPPDFTRSIEAEGQFRKPDRRSSSSEDVIDIDSVSRTTSFAIARNERSTAPSPDVSNQKIFATNGSIAQQIDGGARNENGIILESVHVNGAHFDVVDSGRTELAQSPQLETNTPITDYSQTPEPTSAISEPPFWGESSVVSTEPSHCQESVSEQGMFVHSYIHSPSSNPAVESRCNSAIADPTANPERFVLLAQDTVMDDAEPQEVRSRGQGMTNNSNYMDLPFNRLEKLPGSCGESLNADQRINPERLAMLASLKDVSHDDEDTEMTNTELEMKARRHGKGKVTENSNYLNLPFNRLQ